MTRLFAAMCNEPHRLKYALYPIRQALMVPGADLGWGMAYFQGDKPLLKQHPTRVEGKLDLFAALEPLRSDYLVVHIGHPNESPLTQPLRYRNWAFAHAGRIHDFAKVQPRFLEHIPDYLRRNLNGIADSEYFFQLFLAFLHDSGKSDDPHLTPQDLVAAVRNTVNTLVGLDATRDATKDTLNLVVTNGRMMLALRYGRPMWMRRATGLRGVELHPELRDQPTKPATDHLRLVAIMSDPTELVGEGWEEIPDRTALVVDRNLGTSVHQL